MYRQNDIEWENKAKWNLVLSQTFDFYDFKPFHTFLNDFEIFTLQLFFPHYLDLVTSLLCLVPPSSNSMILIVIALCIKVHMKWNCLLTYSKKCSKWGRMVFTLLWYHYCLPSYRRILCKLEDNHDATMWTQSDVKSQKIEYLCKYYNFITKLLSHTIWQRTWFSDELQLGRQDLT